MLRVIPLGGLGEVGLNAMVFEHGNDMLLVDAGLMFPSADHPSVDIVIPDFSYIRENVSRLRGILLTHGHEDHIGALPFLLRDVKVPVYGTKFTLGLVEYRLQESNIKADLREIHPRERFSLTDTLSVEPIRVAHSMPDAVGFALGTPEGTVVHTGDFKIDETPIDGERTDLARLSELADEGVLCLFSDSTNAEVTNDTPSEKTVEDCFERIFAQAPGRVIVSMFASHLLRVQHLLTLSHRLGRRVVLLGRSMQRNVELAQRLGTLKVPEGLFISAEESSSLPQKRVTVVCTGAQAEPRAGLSQLLASDGRAVQLVRGDTVILSARPIPGNERAVTGLIDALLERGALLHYSALDPSVHVSGHASRNQQRRVVETVRPKHFVPIHGELHQLMAHGELARRAGVEEILLSRDGDVLGFKSGKGQTIGRVPAGRIFASRNSGLPVDFETLEDRSLLNLTGVVAAAVVIERGSLRLVSGPHLSARGLTPGEDGHLGKVAQQARVLLEEVSVARRGDESFIRAQLMRAVREAFKKEFGRKLTVVPLVVYL